jgi:hypothetical protein
MTNLLARAINCDDGDRAAKIIQQALGVESDDVANNCFPKTWPSDREQRARIYRRLAANGSAHSGVTRFRPRPVTRAGRSALLVQGVGS